MDHAAHIGKWLLIFGAVLMAVGGVLWLAARLGLPLGQLPGDIRVDRENVSFRFPLTTCILASAVLTILANLLIRLFRH